MRILHTSDWHIGKRLLGRDRLTEQAQALDEIAEICDRENVEVVLVAGDVFDTYPPSAEAEDLFYEKIKKIAGTDRAVLIISGNHDDNVRLGAATSLAETQGIYIYGNFGYVPKGKGHGKITVKEAGSNFIVFSDGRDDVFFNVLPYPNETRLKEDKNPDEAFFDKMKRWIAAGQSANRGDLPCVFLSHLFVAGGRVSEGERDIDLGGARAVPLDLLPQCDYAALGHLHRSQHFKNNVYYSGSILQYAFDEAGLKKNVVVFDLTKQGAENIREIELRSGKKLVRLKAQGIEQSLALLPQYPDCFIELTIYLNEPLISSQIKILKDANEGLISIIPEIGSVRETSLRSLKKNLSAKELFTEYYKELFSEQPPAELEELFLTVMGEADET